MPLRNANTSFEKEYLFFIPVLKVVYILFATSNKVVATACKTGKSAKNIAETNIQYCNLPLTKGQSWAKLLRSLTVNSLSYFVKIKY